MTEYCTGCRKIKGENMTDNSLELISEITVLNKIHEFMQDDQLARAMAIVVKLIMKQGEIPAIKAVPLIVELQALSTQFALASARYATFDSGPARSDIAHKKNVYYTAKEAINKLVDALKISAKYGLEN